MSHLHCTPASENTNQPVHVKYKLSVYLYEMISRLVFCLLLISCMVRAQETNISAGSVFDGEPFIAINPSNPTNIVIAWMGFVFNNGSGLTIKVRSSFDGGNTWNAPVIIPHQSGTYKSADVSMAFDQTGKLFICFIDWRESPDSGGVFVSRSIDGGLTWTSPVKARDVADDGSKLPVDRPWLSVDPTGMNLFITTKPAPTVAPPNRPYLTVSNDGGLSWQTWRYIDSTGYLTGNVIAAPMAANAFSGTTNLHTVYPSYLLSQSIYARFIHASSTDNGNTFNYHVLFSGSGNGSNDSAKLGYTLVASTADSLHLAFVFPASINGDFDIFLSETRDGGVTWTSPARVNDDPVNNGKMQDLPWAAFDIDDDLVITWRDRRNGSGAGYNDQTQMYCIFRDHDSTNMPPNFALSDSLIAFDPVLAQNGNDFMSCQLHNDTIYACWSDVRDNSLDVWLAKINGRDGNTVSLSNIANESSGFEIIYSNDRDIIIKAAIGKTIEEVVFLDSNGKEVFRGQYNSPEVSVDSMFLPGGIYIVMVKLNGVLHSKKIILKN
jgi:hypothetical protein